MTKEGLFHDSVMNIKLLDDLKLRGAHGLKTDLRGQLRSLSDRMEQDFCCFENLLTTDSTDCFISLKMNGQIKTF